jgi:hypothetical protein
MLWRHEVLHGHVHMCAWRPCECYHMLALSGYSVCHGRLICGMRWYFAVAWRNGTPPKRSGLHSQGPRGFVHCQGLVGDTRKRGTATRHKAILHSQGPRGFVHCEGLVGDMRKYQTVALRACRPYFIRPELIHNGLERSERCRFCFAALHQRQQPGGTRDFASPCWAMTVFPPVLRHLVCSKWEVHSFAWIRRWFCKQSSE